MWYCKKTNRSFDSFRSFINHIRNEYDSIEKAYILEYNVSPPKCKYCGNICAFISYKKGYSNICNNKECIYKKISDNNRDLAQKRKSSGKFKKKEAWELTSSPLYKKISYEDFKYYIFKNIDFYRNNINKNNIVEPFTQRYLKKQKLKDFINGKTIGKDPFIIKSKCENCYKIYERYLLDPNYDTYCKKCLDKIRKNFTKNKFDYYITIKGGKKISTKNLNNIFVSSFYKSYDADKLINRYKITKIDVINNTLIKRFKNFNVKHIWKCPETGWFIPVQIKGDGYLIPFLKSMGIDHIWYIEKYLPDIISYCRNCGNVVEIGKNILGSVKKDNRFCNHLCYNKFRKYNDVGNVTENSINKISNIMRKKIESGSWKPELNNWKGCRVHHRNQSFRSSWEALFYEIMLQNNKNVLYEKLIIKYYDTIKKKYRNYIVDFIDYENECIYEIKPSVYTNGTNEIDKEKSAYRWCYDNGFSYNIIDENFLKLNCNKFIMSKLNKNIQKKLKGVIGVLYEN